MFDKEIKSVSIASTSIFIAMLILTWVNDKLSSSEKYITSIIILCAALLMVIAISLSAVIRNKVDTSNLFYFEISRQLQRHNAEEMLKIMDVSEKEIEKYSEKLRDDKFIMDLIDEIMEDTHDI